MRMGVMTMDDVVKAVTKNLNLSKNQPLKKSLLSAFRKTIILGDIPAGTRINATQSRQTGEVEGRRPGEASHGSGLALLARRTASSTVSVTTELSGVRKQRPSVLSCMNFLRLTMGVPSIIDSTQDNPYASCSLKCTVKKEFRIDSLH